MLKKILSIEGIQELDKKSQRATQGGQLLCEDQCVLGLRLCYISKTETIQVPC